MTHRTMLVLIVLQYMFICNGNLILQLIQLFGKIHNVSQITACLPLPKSAASPVDWGILTLDLN